MNLPAGEGWQWIGGVCAVIAAFLLKHLHNRVAQAAQKEELAEALRAVAALRREDLERAEQYRRERREVESEIFRRLGGQDVILSRIDERTAKLTSK